MTILFAPFAKKMRNDKRNPKNYPWPKELVESLSDHKVIQAGQTGEEQVAPYFYRDLTYQQLGEVLLDCDTFIGVDSYLQHYAWSIGRRGVVLWGQSDPLIYGHDLHINLLKDRKYLRHDQFNVWEACEVNDEAFVSPVEVVQSIKALV